MVASWEQNLTETIMVDMFPPPTASRIYAYSNIAAYEALRFTDSTKLSFAGRLNGLGELPLPEKNLDYDYRVSALTAFSTVAAEFTYTKDHIRSFEKTQSDSLLKTGIDPTTYTRSVEFGKLLAASILKWAGADNFKKTRGMVRYTLQHNPSSWEPTPPDYLQGAEPHWDKIRPFTIDSASQFRPDSIPVAFSTSPSSEFYQNAVKIVTSTRSIDSNQLSMTAFWDDNPGVSSVYGHMKQIKKKMTPGGHWMAITGNVVQAKKMDMSSSAELFAVTAIAISDAFITCWDAKYHFQTIRPITYIHRHITTDWLPILQTPAFPEFPSGHATISAAAATVLTAYAGDNFSFTDSTEFQFGLPVRSFTSFMEAAKESAASRFYGGIHFMPSNIAGTKLGIETGTTVLNKIRSKPVL